MSCDMIDSSDSAHADASTQHQSRDVLRDRQRHRERLRATVAACHVRLTYLLTTDILQV